MSSRVNHATWQEPFHLSAESRLGRQHRHIDGNYYYVKSLSELCWCFKLSGKATSLYRLTSLFQLRVDSRVAHEVTEKCTLYFKYICANENEHTSLMAATFYLASQLAFDMAIEFMVFASSHSWHEFSPKRCFLSSLLFAVWIKN